MFLYIVTDVQRGSICIGNYTSGFVSGISIEYYSVINQNTGFPSPCTLSITFYVIYQNTGFPSPCTLSII